MASHSHIDFRSGQLVSDQHVKARSFLSDAKGHSWAHESPFLPAGWAEGSAEGANPLQRMALRTAMLDQRVLTAEHFKILPWELAKLMWDMLGYCEKQTLYMWKLLATVYPTEFWNDLQACRRRSFKIKELRIAFHQYLDLIRVSGTKLHWTTTITLSNDHFDATDLVALSRVTNLVALGLSCPPPFLASQADLHPQPVSLSDRIIRGWADLAASRTAFAHLHILLLRSQPDVSDYAFALFSRFPSLVGIAVVECPQLTSVSARTAAQRNGWIDYDLSRRKDIIKTAGDFLDDYLGSVAEEDRYSKELQSKPRLDFAVEPLDTRRRAAKPVVLYSRKRPVAKPVLAAPEKPRQKSRQPVVKTKNRKDMMGLLAEMQG